MPRHRKAKAEPQPGRRPARKSTGANKQIDLALAHRIQSGDRRAVDELTRKYEGFAYRLALKAHAKSGLELEDLCQEARMGLLKAAERYEPERDLAFMTYATWWVRHKLARYIADHNHLIRVPVNAQIKLTRATRRGELEKATKIVADALEAQQMTIVPIDGSTECYGTIPDVGDHESGHDAEQSLLNLIEQSRDARLLRDLLQQLPEQERLILECRYFKSMTLTETAAWLHKFGFMKKEVSRERIRQIETNALRRLKNRLLYNDSR